MIIMTTCIAVIYKLIVLERLSFLNIDLYPVDRTSAMTAITKFILLYAFIDSREYLLDIGRFGPVTKCLFIFRLNERCNQYVLFIMHSLHGAYLQYRFTYTFQSLKFL